MSLPAVETSCGIAVMAKVSRPGLSKTRLIPALGAEGAARLNTAFLQDAAANILAAARAAPIRGYAAFGPPEARPFFDILPAAIGLVEAWCPEFGDTLIAAMNGVLGRGHPCACLVNADSPTLPPALLARAASALRERRCDLVLGPAIDGGYYLVGAHAVHRGLFEAMTWSVDTVFAETLARAETLGLAVERLDPWYDVDDGDSFAVLRGELFENRNFGPSGLTPGAAAATRGLLATRLASQPTA